MNLVNEGEHRTSRLTYAMSSAVEAKLRLGTATLRRSAWVLGGVALVAAAFVFVALNLSFGPALGASFALVTLVVAGLPTWLIIRRVHGRFATEEAALRTGVVIRERRIVTAARLLHDRDRPDEFWIETNGSPPLRFEVGSSDALAAWQTGWAATFVFLPDSRWLLAAVDDDGRVIYHAEQYDPAADPRWEEWLKTG